MKKLLKALHKIISSKVVDCSNFDIDVLDSEEISFERGTPQTRYEPEVPAEKKIKILSIFVTGLEIEDVVKGDKLKLNFSFKEDGFDYYIENKTADVEKVVPQKDGLEIVLKNLYAVWLGSPVGKKAG
jgi:hypothetical protein